MYSKLKQWLTKRKELPLKPKEVPGKVSNTGILDHSIPNRERKINAVFDYYHQVYRNTEGKLITEELNWDFPCPKCHGPSEFVSCNTYFEKHKCLECGYEFKVD